MTRVVSRRVEPVVRDWPREAGLLLVADVRVFPVRQVGLVRVDAVPGAELVPVPLVVDRGKYENV